MPPGIRLKVRKLQIYLSRRQNLVLILCCMYLGLLAMLSLRGDRGLLKSYHLWQESQNLDTQISKLKTETVDLRLKVYLFKTNLRTVERYARENLRLAGENEIHYIFR